MEHHRERQPYGKSKPRKVLTLEERVQALRMFDYMPVYQRVATAFQCSWEQIKNVVLSRHEIMRFYARCQTIKPKDHPNQIRKKKILFLGNVVYEYIKRALYYGGDNATLDEQLLRERALEFTEAIGIEKFYPNNAWIKDFRRIYNVDFENTDNIVLIKPPPKILNCRKIIEYCQHEIETISNEAENSGEADNSKARKFNRGQNNDEDNYDDQSNNCDDNEVEAAGGDEDQNDEDSDKTDGDDDDDDVDEINENEEGETIDFSQYNDEVDVCDSTKKDDEPKPKRRKRNYGSKRSRQRQNQRRRQQQNTRKSNSQENAQISSTQFPTTRTTTTEQQNDPTAATSTTTTIATTTVHRHKNVVYTVRSIKRAQSQQKQQKQQHDSSPANVESSTSISPTPTPTTPQAAAEKVTTIRTVTASTPAVATPAPAPAVAIAPAALAATTNEFTMPAQIFDAKAAISHLYPLQDYALAEEDFIAINLLEKLADHYRGERPNNTHTSSNSLAGTQNEENNCSPKDAFENL